MNTLNAVKRISEDTPKQCTETYNSSGYNSLERQLVYKDLEEVKNVLIDICDECGNITSIPHRSVSPIQQAMKRLVESRVASEPGKIPVELKSRVDPKKSRD